ncbi:MAG: hypothetical protein IT429_18915 [Gemmataceae bacterium]|nr:hypothetical protein [Gemmataceae bacterium]
MGVSRVRRVGLAAAAAVLVFAAAPAWGCNVPVFRYALERWRADPYDVIVFHRGPLSPADKALTDALAKHAATEPAVANYWFDLIDLDRKLPPEIVELFESQPVRDLPLLVVRYPETVRVRDPRLWSGKLTRASVQALLDSPARREIAQRILAGDSAVWLLLECGDRGKDDAAAKLLGDEVARLQKTLKLPGLTADPEDRLSEKGPELKLAFSVLRVARDDPKERFLVQMLQRLEDDLPSNKPMVYPVFGRGRAKEPLIGAGITAENIEADARFLIGPCTCKVKEQNPGVYLLAVADWETAPDRQPTITLPGESPAPPATAATVAVSPPELGAGPALVRNALVATAGGLVLVGAFTFLLARKNRGHG